MGESGKRHWQHRDRHDLDNRNQKRRFNEKDEQGYDELVVYRILCPNEVIGSVIGKSGKIINSIRQYTRAKVKVVDPFPGANNRVITIYCYVKEKRDIDVDDEFNDREPLCSAQDALLRFHSAISNAVSSMVDSDKKQRDREECQILVPSSQSANIIGKAGSTIKKLRTKTRANIKVTAKDVSDPTQSCAMDFDNFILITGESEAVKRALFAVSAIIYKFSPKEVIPLETNVPEAPPSIIIPSDIPIYPSGGLFPHADPIVSSRSVPQILGSTHVPELQGYGDAGSTRPIYSSTLPIVPNIGSTSRFEDLILRVLCPFDKIGRVIGKGGGTIKSIRQASGARIEVDDTKKVDRDDCIITVTSTESPDDLKSMGVEAILLLQGKINDDDDDTGRFRLLVPSKVIGCIIGKSGSIVNKIRKRTRADIRISKGEKSKSAGSSDEVVEVLGAVENVRDALVQIVLRLRDDVLKENDGRHDHSAAVDPLYPGGSAISVPSLLSSIPPVAPLGYDQRAESGNGFGLLSSSRLYGYGSSSMGDNGYGSVSSYSYSSSNMYGDLPSPSTLEMLVPPNAVSKVIGKGGINLSNIRKISGALVEISDAKSARGDRVALISGTPEQKRSAENLIQAFIMAT